MDSRELFENHSIFWSRLGLENDPPRLDKNGKLIEFKYQYDRFAQLHKTMNDIGIKLHTSLLFSGWIGPDTYDYALTDQTLESLFKKIPDALYIPRIKLNAPVEWQKEHPEELFVYWGESNDPEFIRSRIGTLEHDLLGHNSPNGYCLDDRPNMDGHFCNQSFASKIWLHDAEKALLALMRHIARTPYAKNIIGYHIGYGTCGETCLWGRTSRRYGDYSRVFRHSFMEWGIKKYGDKACCLAAWGTERMPPPEIRRNVYTGVEAFLRRRKTDRIVVDLDLYMSELNASVAEKFCQVVKRENPSMFTGVFYGYTLECYNANYSGWLNIDQLLDSPFVDFIAAPTSYYRRGAGESGGHIVPAASVNRKKIFLDELDIRTYLESEKSLSSLWKIPQSATKAVLCREVAKNLAVKSGFWWMDLGGGWYDSEFMHEQIRYAEQIARNVREVKKRHSTADVLVIADEQSLLLHTESADLFNMHHFVERELGLSGVLYEIYRMKDLAELELSKYKMILLRDCVAIPESERLLLEQFSGIVICSYLDGMAKARLPGINPVTHIAFAESPESFPAGPIAFNGVASGEFEFKGCPLPRIVPTTKTANVFACFSDGSPALVSCDGRRFHAVLPLLGWRQLRAFAEYAGCRTYGQAPCSVYGDSAFTAIFPHNTPDEFTFELHSK